MKEAVLAVEERYGAVEVGVEPPEEIVQHGELRAGSGEDETVELVVALQLAVVGEHDHLTPPEYHEELADRIPDGRYQEIPDAAHLAMLERPEALNAAVLDFLNDAGI